MTTDLAVANNNMLADNVKVALQAIHTDTVNKAGKDKKKNIVLDDLPHPISDPKKTCPGSNAPPSQY